MDVIDIDGWGSLPTCSYGSTPELEERLAALVIMGRKRATVWAATEPNVTEPGMHWAVTVAGRPVAIVETVSIDQRRFCDVDAAFAATEGEGDLSLAFWQAAHRSYFRQNGQFDPKMLLWCETFRLVHVIDRALADATPAHVEAEIAEVEGLMQRWREEAGS